MLFYILYKYYFSKHCIYFHTLLSHIISRPYMMLVSRFKISSKLSVVTADYRKIYVKFRVGFPPMAKCSYQVYNN